LKKAYEVSCKLNGFQAFCISVTSPSIAMTAVQRYCNDGSGRFTVCRAAAAVRSTMLLQVSRQERNSFQRARKNKKRALIAFGETLNVNGLLLPLYRPQYA
jgi:hypothetical protein